MTPTWHDRTERSVRLANEAGNHAVTAVHSVSLLKDPDEFVVGWRCLDLNCVHGQGNGSQ
jgi:hypothetical protein